MNVGRHFRDDACRLVAGRVRRFGLDLIFARDHQRIREAEADCMHANAHVTGLELRRWDLLHAELRRRTITAQNDSAHAITPLDAKKLTSSERRRWASRAHPAGAAPATR